MENKTKQNRLQALFGRKDAGLLSVYFTAGFPSLDSTGDIIRELAHKGVDMIEVGVPFSDPMADGKVIQDSSSKALANGMTLEHLLTQVEETRRKASEEGDEKTSRIPLVLMGYLNPMIQFGPERLFARCAQAGIDAMIIPDLPFEEYMRDYRPLCERYGIDMIMLITPETSDDRIRLIDENSDGFIYMVSSAATTGTRDRFGEEQLGYFRRINGMSLRNRRLIGFGISNPSTLADAMGHSSGAIIGSLFIKCLGATDSIPAAVDALLEKLMPKQ